MRGVVAVACVHGLKPLLDYIETLIQLQASQDWEAVRRTQPVKARRE
jgi:hypothetical protein